MTNVIYVNFRNDTDKDDGICPHCDTNEWIEVGEETYQCCECGHVD